MSPVSSAVCRPSPPSCMLPAVVRVLHRPCSPRACERSVECAPRRSCFLSFVLHLLSIVRPLFVLSAIRRCHLCDLPCMLPAVMPSIVHAPCRRACSLSCVLPAVCAPSRACSPLFMLPVVHRSCSVVRRCCSPPACPPAPPGPLCSYCCCHRRHGCWSCCRRRRPSCSCTHPPLFV